MMAPIKHWITTEGERWEISRMTDAHLNNVIRYFSINRNFLDNIDKCPALVAIMQEIARRGKVVKDARLYFADFIMDDDEEDYIKALDDL